MKRLLPLLLVFSLITLAGCEDFFDCIVNRRPELPNKEFGVGDLQTYYYEEFDAQIKNEPRDNDYDYEFEIDGILPEGLQMVVNYRTVSIEGLPTFPGTFTFIMNLYVIPPLDFDGNSEKILCSESTSKEYTIRINP